MLHELRGPRRGCVERLTGRSAKVLSQQGRFCGISACSRPAAGTRHAAEPPFARTVTQRDNVPGGETRSGASGDVVVPVTRPTLSAAPELVDVCRLVRVTVDWVARAIPQAPSIVLDLPALSLARTDGRVLGLLLTHVVRHVVEETAGPPDATVDVTLRAGECGDHVEILVAGHRRSGGGRLALAIGLARDLAGALRGDVDFMHSGEKTITVLIRVPSST